MFLNKNKMAKLDEVVIAEQYSRYLQRVSIAAANSKFSNVKLIDQEAFLKYDEFKDYYILNLVGKGDMAYINKLVSEFQHKNLTVKV